MSLAIHELASLPIIRDAVAVCGGLERLVLLGQSQWRVANLESLQRLWSWLRESTLGYHDVTVIGSSSWSDESHRLMNSSTLDDMVRNGRHHHVSLRLVTEFVNGDIPATLRHQIHTFILCSGLDQDDIRVISRIYQRSRDAEIDFDLFWEIYEEAIRQSYVLIVNMAECRVNIYKCQRF